MNSVSISIVISITITIIMSVPISIMIRRTIKGLVALLNCHNAVLLGRAGDNVSIKLAKLVILGHRQRLARDSQIIKCREPIELRIGKHGKIWSSIDRIHNLKATQLMAS